MRKYYLPEGLRVYAIGDVHGHFDALKAMHEAITVDLIQNPPEDVHIIYLGDYIDRGPDSRAVIEYLMTRRDRGDGIPKSFLKGNHEAALFEFMKNPLGHDWFKYGGMETLKSYGFEFEGEVPLPSEAERAAEVMPSLIPQAHFDFFNSLELSVEVGDYFFAHAGVDPKKPFAMQDEWDLTRSRSPFLSWHKHKEYQPLEKMVVHGHSIEPEAKVHPHRIGVDTGRYEGGPLTAAVIEGESVRFLQV